MSDSSTTVSVVIRVRNEAGYLRKTLAALAAQSGPPLQVVVVDNESTDGSRQVALSAGAIVLHLPRLEFTYGRALNMGIEAATSEIVVLLSAHSLPVGPHFIQNALLPFDDPRVAAVRCLHASNRTELETWATPVTLSWPVELGEVIEKGPIACGCAIRRSVWALQPFNEKLRSVEDKFWAYEVLKRGHLISSSAAAYLYMRDVGVLDKVRKLNVDRLAYYEHTGKVFEGHPNLRDLLVDLFYALPRRALRGAVQDILLCLMVKTVPWQARYESVRSKQRVGTLAGNR